MTNYCKDCENCIPNEIGYNKESKIALATCKKYLPTGSYSETLVTGQTPRNHQYCSVVRGSILQNVEDCPDFVQKITKEVENEKTTTRLGFIDRFRAMLGFCCR